MRKTADADRLAATYPGIFPLKLDVTKEESIKIAVGKVKDILAEKKLPLVALINNAGVQKDLPGIQQRGRLSTADQYFTHLLGSPTSHLANSSPPYHYIILFAYFFDS